MLRGLPAMVSSCPSEACDVVHKPGGPSPPAPLRSRREVHTSRHVPTRVGAVISGVTRLRHDDSHTYDRGRGRDHAEGHCRAPAVQRRDQIIPVPEERLAVTSAQGPLPPGPDAKATANPLVTLIQGMAVQASLRPWDPADRVPTRPHEVLTGKHAGRGRGSCSDELRSLVEPLPPGSGPKRGRPGTWCC